MKINLDREMLIDMVKGVEPPYEIIEQPFIKMCGYYSDSGMWRWYPNFELCLDDDELMELYELCKGRGV